MELRIHQPAVEAAIDLLRLLCYLQPTQPPHHHMPTPQQASAALSGEPTEPRALRLPALAPALHASSESAGHEARRSSSPARACIQEHFLASNLTADLVCVLQLETDEALLVAAARALGAAADTSLPTLAGSTEAVERAGSNNALVLHQLHAVHRLVQMIPDAALGRVACD